MFSFGHIRPDQLRFFDNLGVSGKKVSNLHVSKLPRDPRTREKVVYGVYGTVERPVESPPTQLRNYRVCFAWLYPNQELHEKDAEFLMDLVRAKNPGVDWQ